MENITFAPAGDQGVVMRFGSVVSEAVNQRIRAMVDSMEREPLKGVTEVIPSFCSLLVLYDPLEISYEKLQSKLEKRAGHLHGESSSQKVIHEIPVCYEGEFAEDLPDVAAHAGLSVEETIKLHAGRDYLIYMLGFLPGFVYLGGMDSRLACPRLDSPRTKIPAGSVGIGGEQTGIYPLVSPGGWRLIGRTPVKVYDPKREPSILYSMGEYIRFLPVTRQEYDRILEKAENGTYMHNVRREGL